MALFRYYRRSFPPQGRQSFHYFQGLALRKADLQRSHPALGWFPSEGWAACAPALAEPCRDGIVTDCRAPLTTVAISTGCMLVPIEIFPTTEPASDGRPSAWANSCEIRRRPSLMLSNCASAS